MNKKCWTYETKCRRCGKLTTWVFCEVGQIDNTRVLDAIHNKIIQPRLERCDVCKKNTIQDIVSYEKEMD